MLDQSGVHIHCNGHGDHGVHTKIIVDDEIAIVSSMNLIPTSKGGSSWETGIVTCDSKVVDSIAASVKDFLDECVPYRQEKQM